MTIKDYKCPRCQCHELYFARLDERKVGLYCTQCAKWLKWADKEERKRMNLPDADVRENVHQARKDILSSAETTTVSPDGKPMMHFKGDIGEFDYDPEEFRLITTGDIHHLIYTGEETDGSRIHIPEGIISCSGMFKHNVHLKTPPVIPESARFFNSMFYGCSSLTEAPALPKGTCSYDTKNMLYGCIHLIRGTINV